MNWLKDNWPIVVIVVAIVLALLWRWEALLPAGLALFGAGSSDEGESEKTVRDRPEAENEEPTHEVADSVQAAEADVRASSDGGKESLSEDVESLADELRNQRKGDS